MTICDKTWKITGQTYQKYVEFNSSYWARRDFQPKKFCEIIDKAFLINTATDNENIHPTQICKKCYLQWLLKGTQLYL